MTMDRRFAFFILLACWAGNYVLARQLNTQEALNRVVRNNAMSRSSRIKDVLRYKLVHTIAGQDVNYIYVYEPSAGGDAIFVAADDLLPAVMAYGVTRFDTNNMPPQMREWIKFYSAVSAEVIASGIPLKAAVTSGNAVAPLLNTYWEQNAPYNDLCRKQLEADVPTGCVATSMAQVMNYWKYPAHGYGSHSYTIKNHLLRADFGSEHYDWDNMLTAYGNYCKEGESGGSFMSYDNIQALAVSTLMFHCGVATEMNYDESGSGTSDIKAGAALANYFGYNNGIRLESRDFYDDQTWENILQTELNKLNPIIYCGATTNNEGHCFVCDGYDGSGFYHFNWGWSGLGNGYYMVTGNDILHPTHQGTGGSLSSGAFNQQQTILTDVHPRTDGDSEEYCIQICAGNTIDSSQGNVGCVVMTDTQNELSGDMLRGQTYILKGGFYNYSITPANAEIGVILHNIVNGADYVCDGTMAKDMNPYSGYSYYSFTVDAVPENGKYEVFPAYKPLDKNGKALGEWKRMKMNSNAGVYQVNISGTIPVLRITDLKLSQEGNATSLFPKLDITLTALNRVSKLPLTAYVYEWDGNNMLNYYTIATSLNMTKGDVQTITGLTPKMSKELDAGKAYRLEIKSRTYEYNLGNTELTKYFFVTESDETTGIASIIPSEKSVAKSELYDLMGRKVNGDNIHGIYIQNGKKVIR